MRAVIKWLPQVQLLMLAIAGSVSAIVSLLDLMDLVDSVPWFTPNLGKISLLLISIVMLELVFQREQIKNLDQYLLNIQTNNFNDLQHKVNPTLQRVFGDHIRAMIVSASAAVVHQTVRVEGMSNLRVYYNKTLEIFPNRSFYATSVASESYYWKPGTFEETIRAFLANGGIMERIFFIDDELGVLSDEERRVIAVHMGLGVKVYTIPERFVPDELKRLFVVEASSLIGWESFISHTKEIRSSIATTDPRVTEDLRENFLKIKKMGATRLMEPFPLSTAVQS